MNDQPIRLLLIEDSPTQSTMIQAALRGVPGVRLEIRHAERLSAALEKLSQGDVDIVLSDLSLPDSQGLETFEKVHAQAPQVPIVILTASQQELEMGVEALQKGAQDYLIKAEVDGKILVRTIRYAIERKAVEKKIQEVADMKSAFTSMVSHELRTPLAVVKESVNVVLDGSTGPLNPEQQKFLQIAQRNLDRLARLTTAVLDFQKLDGGFMEFQMVSQEINPLVREVVEGFAFIVKNKGLGLIQRLEEGLPRVRCDKDKITQVLINLLNNAIKFTEKGRILVATAREEGGVRVSVQDSGPGIKEEDRSKLFQSFSQLYPESGKKKEGTGLGLAISKKIVERHEGRMGVQSLYGQGTTFYFILPPGPEPLR